MQIEAASDYDLASYVVFWAMGPDDEQDDEDWDELDDEDDLDGGDLDDEEIEDWGDEADDDE